MFYSSIRKTKSIDHWIKYWKSFWRAFQFWKITKISFIALSLKHQTKSNASYENAEMICSKHVTFSDILKQHSHSNIKLLLLFCSKQDAWNVIKNEKPHLSSFIMKQLFMKKLILREWISSDHYLSKLFICVLFYRINVR